jgi:hypothetical protein
MRIQFCIWNNLLTTKYILKKGFVVQVFVQQDKDSGLSAIYGNADPVLYLEQSINQKYIF